jgi:HAE1 family hydrophobic/amphiphilic exporter-1
LSKSTAGQVQQQLTQEFNALDFPEGYGFKFVGQAEFQEESGREIFKAFILAVILTYMLLVAVMNSYIHPFTIVTTVATSCVGVVFLMFFMDFTINIGSLMSIVMLVGLVVNNAILMIDYAQQMQAQGHGLKEAIWLGASVKFRAIVMTSLAVVFGALPQMFDIDKVIASMGGVIIGGMFGSIFFTFFQIPITFWYMERMRMFFAKLLTRP